MTEPASGFVRPIRDARPSRDRRRLCDVMKLLAFGLLLLAAATAMLFFSYLDPTTLFIGGVICTFLGVINLLSLSYGLGAGASQSDTTNAIDLVRASDRDSALHSGHGFNDHI